MVNRQRDHLQCQTDQSQMSSIGSPTPLRIELENCSNVVISKKSYYEINPYRETGAFATHFL